MTKTSMTLMLVIGVVSCGGAASPGEDTSTTISPETTTTEEQVTTTEPEYAGELAPMVEAARTDLADRLDVDERTIAVVSAESVTWPDGALGCPESGKMYTQALVEGSRIVLEYAGDSYDYHAGSDGEPFLCESGGGLVAP